jgi:hypothetical protein
MTPVAASWRTKRLGGLPAALLLMAAAARSAPPDPLLARTAKAADEFQRNAPRLVSTELLHQTSFVRPPHAVITVGAAAIQATTARFLNHDIVSEYGFGHLKGRPPTELLEFRELQSLDGRPIQTPAAARQALSGDVNSGEDRIRKHLLEELTKLGLVDVATDYGTILLAFTTPALEALATSPATQAFIGTEEALRIDWQQDSGGALEFRGRKVARRLLEGSIWIRKSDGLPLRISATFGHDEARRTLRDDAIVDYVISELGFPTPVTVVHRHYIDGEALTENLYRYEPFRLFTTDSTIRFEPITAK